MWGRLEADSEEQMIMAHPPETSSDLSFDQWVESALEQGHALKVDFKTPRVISPVLDILAERAFLAERLILNADVGVGPGGGPSLFSVADMEPVRAAFPGAIISLGLTTATWGGAYQTEHVNRLLDAAAKLGAPVTVCLRLELLLADVSVLQTLEAADCHVTIWNNSTTFPATLEILEHIRHLAPQSFIDLHDSSGKPVSVQVAPV